MLTKRTKLLIGESLIFTVLGCIGINLATKTTNNTSGQLPRIKVDIRIDTKQRQIFFDQLQKFADKHDFTIQIDVQPSGPEDFLIYMTRKDIIISGANVFAPEEYKLGVYDAADPQSLVSESALDDLVTDLKIFVSEVPSTTISVEK